MFSKKIYFANLSIRTTLTKDSLIVSVTSPKLQTQLQKIKLKTTGNF